MSNAWLIRNRNTWYDWRSVVIADSEDEARQTCGEGYSKEKNIHLCIPLPKGTVIGIGGYIDGLSKIIEDSSEYTFNKCMSYDHGRGPTGVYANCSCKKEAKV